MVEPLTPEQAGDALAEAGLRAAAVRNSDRQFRPMLLAIAGTYVGVYVAIAVTSGAPGAFGGVLVNAVVIAGVVSFGLAMARQHAYTRAGKLLFAWSVGVWAVWLSTVMQLSISSGWWGTNLTGSNAAGTSCSARPCR